MYDNTTTNTSSDTSLLVPWPIHIQYDFGYEDTTYYISLIDLISIYVHWQKVDYDIALENRRLRCLTARITTILITDPRDISWYCLHQI